MYSDNLVIINDPSDFKAADPHKYFQNCIKFIRFDMAIDLFFTDLLYYTQ